MKHSPKKPKSRPAGRRQGIRNAIGRARNRPTARAHVHPESSARSSHVVVPDAAKVGIGMLGGGSLCALVDREDWLPPWLMTGLTAAVGVGLAALSPETRLVGYGTIGGALLERLAAEILDSSESKESKEETKPSSPPATPPASPPVDTHRQSSFEGFGLPPGALESAYQRARERLAMEAATDPSR